MNALTNLLKRLPSLKTSTDFADALVDLETERDAALAKVSELDAGREAALFDGGNLGKLEADISAAEARAKTLSVAFTGATKRRDEAAESESQAELEKVSGETRKLRKTLRSELIEFGRLADKLSGRAQTITELREQIGKKNTHLRVCGRADLTIVDPWKELPEIVGRVVGDPMRNLHIEEFWPRHRKGPALLKLTK